MQRMRFGVFQAPFHARIDQNPTLALQRDVELAVELDRLGYDEIWFGEHHSGGVELISSPELFCAWVAAQTSRIKVGTGVISLPYHNPLWVADRALLLDHLTKGRFMLGIGSGVLPSDGSMIGLDTTKLRNYLKEDFPVLMHLLRSEDPISIETERYKLVDARVQLDPYSDFDIAVTSIFTQSGPLLAGSHGIGLIQLSGLTPEGMSVLPRNWQIMESQAAKHGTTANRDKWRVVGLMHVAETKDQAIEDVRYGLDDYFDYLAFTTGSEYYASAGKNFDERLEWAMSTGNAFIGTPEEATAKIGELVDASGGNVGAFLFWGHDWARPAATLQSYELFAREVMPAFQNTTKRMRASQRVTSEVCSDMLEKQLAAANKFVEEHSSDTQPANR